MKKKKEFKNTYIYYYYIHTYILMMYVVYVCQMFVFKCFFLNSSPCSYQYVREVFCNTFPKKECCYCVNVYYIYLSKVGILLQSSGFALNYVLDKCFKICHISYTTRKSKIVLFLSSLLTIFSTSFRQLEKFGHQEKRIIMGNEKRKKKQFWVFIYVCM